MHFLNPFFFLGLSTILGPILVHLLRKEESKRIYFSSLVFLQSIPHKTWKQKTLQNWTLLLLRVAGILLLTLGFARPYWNSSFRAVAIPDSRLLLVLIDNSFSMRYGNRLGSARNIANEILRKKSGNDFIQIGIFSDTIEIQNQATENPREIEPLLQAITPGFRKSDYLSVLRQAAQLVAKSPVKIREIHVISDFQESGWKRGEERKLDSLPSVIPHDVSGPRLGNHSVNSPHIEWDENQNVVFAVRVSNSGGTQRKSISTELSLGGKSIQNQTVLLEPDESAVVKFTPIPLPTGVSSGQFSIPSEDPLPGDDTCYFAINAQPSTRILLLSDRIHKDDFYLGRALSSGAHSRFQTELATFSSIPLTDLGRYSLVILNNITSLSTPLFAKLESFVQQGGKLWIVLGDRTDLQQFRTGHSQILPASLIEVQTKKIDASRWHLGRISEKDPAFEIFKDTHLAQLRAVSFSGRILCQPNESSQVLASFADGAPLLLEKPFGRGSCLLFCSSLQTGWNDFPLDPLFVPFVQQLARRSAIANESQFNFYVGDSVPLASLNPRLEREISRISSISSSFFQNWRIISPSGKPMELRDENLLNNPLVSLNEQGFYQTTVQNAGHIVAVNIDPDESQMESFDPVNRFVALQRNQETFVSSRDGRESFRETSLVMENQTGVWPVCFSLALAVFLVESLISNFYTFPGRAIDAVPRNGLDR
ncbi:MAG: BatA domain-containing protein [Terriglobia bacterium]